LIAPCNITSGQTAVVSQLCIRRKNWLGSDTILWRERVKQLTFSLLPPLRPRFARAFAAAPKPGVPEERVNTEKENKWKKREGHTYWEALEGLRCTVGNVMFEKTL
jgi:hypothetical protein